MAINWGDTSIVDLKYGDQQVLRAMYGEEQIWPAAGPITSFTYERVGREGSTPGLPTIELMADIIAGDLLIWDNVGTDYSAPTGVTPSGFTIVKNYTFWNFSGAGNGIRRVWGWKIAEGDEGSTTLTGMDNTGFTDFINVVKVRANRPIEGVTYISGSTSSTSGNPSSVSVPVSTQTDAVVTMTGAYKSGGNFSSVSRSPSATVAYTTGTSTATYFSLGLLPTAPHSNVSFDMGDAGNYQSITAGAFVLT